MTGTGILDTSAVIALPRLRSPADLPEHAVTTTVTLAELAVGPLVADDVRERARRQAVLQQAEADLEALPFDMPPPVPSDGWRRISAALATSRWRGPTTP